MQPITSFENLFQGAVSLERTAGGIKPWRIPYEDVVLYPPDGISGKGQIANCVRLSFRSEATEVRVRTVAPDPQMLMDVVIDNELFATAHPDADGWFTFSGLPGREKTIDVYLSQSLPVIVAGLEISEGASWAPAPVTSPRWITYGSSITQCSAAASPSQTWPAIVARKTGWHLTCLGFGGSCHIEPMVARLIRDLPADFISMCLGINVYGGSSLSARTFRPAVIGMVKIVREKHPDIPIALMSPIYSPPREKQPNAVGLTLEMMRQEIVAAVEALRSRGDNNLIYVNGLDIFGPDDVDHLPDNLHPDAEGYKTMAERFLQKVVPQVKLGGK
ncbi:MAG TPA: GDSL family lipase [Firmicutes bacterium]|nr:GDSL family lipase [Bacillota bacterium]